MKKFLLPLLLGLSLTLSAQNRYATQRAPVRLYPTDSRLVARPLSDWLDDGLTCKAFGVIPNDGLDDIVAMRKYRDLCRTWQREMVLVPGIITVSDSLHHPGARLRIRGSGNGTSIQLNNASARAVIVVRANANYGGIFDLDIDVLPNSSSNCSAIELVGPLFKFDIVNVKAGKRYFAGGTNRGLWANLAGGEVLWTTIDRSKFENFKYNIDFGDGNKATLTGTGNLHITNTHATDGDENIRIGYAGGTQLSNNTVGGSRGILGLHLLPGCDDILVSNLFSEVTSGTLVAEVQIDSAANRNSITLVNGGGQPAIIDRGADNDLHITGTSQNVGGGYQPANYRKMPFVDLTGRSTANLLNGGLYLTNAHDSTAATGAFGNGVVFQQKITSGGAINPTGAIYGYRNISGNNLGGLSLWIANYGAYEAARLDYLGWKVRFGNITLTTPGGGYVLYAPNGTRYRVTVNNAGALTTAPY